ncbi:hypothetical protein SLS64_011482 [Diaporthe eres]|uniref:DUF6546 domain-containing protein n=1 Tax=Diaporthe eres TaxID=83184 RepID=A0ABR1NNF5_DIAER
MFEYNLKRLEYRWWDQLPSVPAVTSLALRQQNHRRWEPSTLAHMFARFPRLEEVHYEPWREWNSLNVNPDRQYQHLFESISRCNNNLKRLVVFENFNQQYPAILQKFPVQLMDGTMTQCDSIRKPAPAVSRMVALASLQLEHLAASFIVDASQFFQIEPSWKWPNLTSLALTSRLLTPDGKAAEIKAMLQSAAAAAMSMPQLETMEIWNGRKGIAGLFKYQASRERRRATITWRGTWEMAMEPSVIQAWEAIVQQFHAWRLNMVHEWLDGAVIKSHGDAIHYLKLSSQVVRPISLQQIQIEQEFMEGLTTV